MGLPTSTSALVGFLFQRGRHSLIVLSVKIVKGGHMHIDKNVILSQVSIEEACRVNGIEIRRRNQILCPTHAERMGKPNTHYGNCLIYADNNSYKCHSCGAGGNVISLTMDAQHLDFVDAMKFLATQCCPEAITSDEGEQVKKIRPKRCPLTKEELVLIGLGTSKTSSPVAMADSLYGAKHPESVDSWIGQNLSWTQTGNGDVLLLKEETYSPQDMFREDQDAFWAIVEGKANEARDFVGRQRKNKSVAKFFKTEYGITRDMWNAWLDLKEDAADHAQRLCRRRKKMQASLV